MAAAVEMTRTEPKMNTFTKTPHARSYFVVTGLVSLLLGSLPGCYIEAKIGDDPEGSTGAAEEDATTTPTSYGDDLTATSGLPGTASVSTTTGGSVSITTNDAAGEDITVTAGGPVDPETALEICDVPWVPIEPEQPIFYEGIECADGCSIDLQTQVFVNLFEDYGECLCEAMGCGPLTAGTTGELPFDTETGFGTSDGGEPDGCGEFPPGDAGFTCSCEMCSIDVNSVDGEWVEVEADLETICECMCGGAGCGSPL